MATEHSKSDPDYQFHKQSYDNVVTVIQVSIASIAVTLLLLLWLVV